MAANTFLATTGRGLARASRSANDNWSVEFLLDGQDVRCLAADPLHPDVIYAGTQGKGVLRSDDQGKTWRPAGLARKIVKSLAVSRAEPGAVYAGTKRPPLIFVSRDGGANWEELDAFRRIPSRRFWFSPAELPLTAYVHGIALSPVDPQVIVAGIEYGAVVLSDDGGQSWSDHRPGAMRDCHSITFHVTQGAWVYEAGGPGVAAFSRDGGQTWQQPKGGLDRPYGLTVAADPERPEVWYVSASLIGRFGPVDYGAYIFRHAGGAAWERLEGLPQPPDYLIYALITDPAAPGHLYAGLSNGDVWHSLDYGQAWQKMPFNLTSIATHFHPKLIML